VEWIVFSLRADEIKEILDQALRSKTCPPTPGANLIDGMMTGHSNRQTVTDSFASHWICLFLHIPQLTNIITWSQSTSINDSKPSPTRIPTLVGRLALSINNEIRRREDRRIAKHDGGGRKGPSIQGVVTQSARGEL
jgi:hypothetical protein